MKILLDENIPVQLRALLSRHGVASVNDAAVGWKGVKNGALLSKMEGVFDLLITADKNLYAQQNLSGRSISILVVPTNRKQAVLAMSDQIQAAAERMRTGEYLVLELSGATNISSF